MDEEGNIPEGAEPDVILTQDKILDLNSVEDLRAYICMKDGTQKEIFVSKEMVEEPSQDMRMKAGLSLVGKKLFEHIQKAQQPNLDRKDRKENYNKIKELD